MRAFPLLLVLAVVLGTAHAARPKFLEPGFYGAIARQLISQLETDYGLTPEQAEVVQALYGDISAPETEDAIKEGFSTGALDVTKSEATASEPAVESLNVLNSLLVAKAGDGDVPAVEELLDVNADPNAAAKGETPLLSALLKGNEGLAGVLISRGADTNRPGSDGNTPLLVAISKNAVSSVEELLDHGANANLAGADGELPLLEAVKADSEPIVLSLIDHGANVNLAGPDGDTAFQAVLAKSPINKAWVEEFISAGADVNLPNAKGETPLELAAGDKDIEEALIKAGAAVPPEAELA